MEAICEYISEREIEALAFYCSSSPARPFQFCLAQRRDTSRLIADWLNCNRHDCSCLRVWTRQRSYLSNCDGCMDVSSVIIIQS
ncbi:hypothetical protein J6590_086285 [Homalodisca vitripennis]|nr:hypothetical protein J6590_086285 [Homalodisca vitripennis]